ncbi:MAG: hypothetical protein OHK0029_36720 [Armatimonadaceae bacterium]
MRLQKNHKLTRRAGFWIAAVAFAGLGMAVSACLPVIAQNGGDTSVTRRPNGQFEARIATDRTQYGSNRAVQITLSLTNLGQIPNAVSTGGRREYDFTVRDGRTRQAVYTMSKHRGPVRMVSFNLQPGQSRVNRELWDQRDDAGKPLPRGVYLIEATIYPQETVSTQVFLSENDRPGRPDLPDPDRPNPGNPGVPGRPGSPNTPFRNLESTLKASTRQVRPGNTVKFAYTVRNTAATAQVLSFRSGKQFDLTVVAPNGKTVWVDSSRKLYIQSLTELRLEPGASRTFETDWSVPQEASAGSYRVIAALEPILPGGNGNRDAQVAAAAITVAVGSGGGSEDPGNPGVPRVVSLRDLVNSGLRAVGQRVRVSGVYIGQQGGYGAPPVRRADWVIASEGVTMYISGEDPGVSAGNTVTVTGIVRRTSDGRTYIERL